MKRTLFVALAGGWLATLLFAVPATAQKADDVLESAETEWPGVRTELLEVKRMADNTVRLRWRWRNTGDKSVRIHVRGTLKSQTYLLDPVNKKKHLVVTDSKGKPIGSEAGDAGGDVTLKAGQALPLWAKFPAPPADVEKITVVIAKTPPFEGVPVAK